MLSHFPAPYNDELLYSICARFSDRVKYSSKKSILLELFGTTNAIAVVDLPGHLGHLSKLLPAKGDYTLEHLLYKHTLLPFYSPFLEPSVTKNVKRRMTSHNGSSVHIRLGVTASRIQGSDWLRLCPECVKDDRARIGESYWHRIHQVPGIKACCIHRAFLEASKVRVHNSKNRHEFIPAENAVSAKTPRLLNENSSDRLLLEIAQDATWLLSQNRLSPGIKVLQQRYISLLAEQGLATYSGKVHTKELLNAFTTYYTQRFLISLECELDVESHSNWLLRLIRAPRGTQHPLRHLLLMHFLVYTAERFFSLPGETRPFGRGPWPCLNPVSTHLRHLCIRACHITYTRDYGKPVGAFHCSCGFGYMRTGPDLIAEDQFRIDRMESFGSIWEESLKGMWIDTRISLREIARRLGVDPMTVKRQANRLGLPFPRSASRLTKKLRLHQAYSKQSKVLSQKCSSDYYNEWLALRERNPNDGRTALRKKALRIHTWLYRNNPEWLEANSPPHQLQIKPRASRVNWKSRDTELAAKGEFVIRRLKKAGGKPIQITEAAIARELGQLALIQKHKDKLPLTARVISESIETREEFAIRRIEYISECYRNEGVYPRRWEFIRRAALRSDLLTLFKINIAIDKALQSLNGHSYTGEETVQICVSQI